MNALLRLTARLHVLQRDDDGLSLLAYALGAAVIIVPIAFAMAGFGSSSVDTAQNALDNAIAP